MGGKGFLLGKGLFESGVRAVIVVEKTSEIGEFEEATGCRCSAGIAGTGGVNMFMTGCSDASVFF